MKNKLTHKRNADFVRKAREIYCNELRRGVVPSTRRLAALTVFGPADKYYISYLHAIKCVYEYLRAAPDQRHKYDDTPVHKRIRHLGEKVRQMVVSENITISQALTTILARGHAPRFYISVSYAMRLINLYRLKIIYDGES